MVLPLSRGANGPVLELMKFFLARPLERKLCGCRLLKAMPDKVSWVALDFLKVLAHLRLVK